MKKISLYVFIALAFCNTSFAEVIKIDCQLSETPGLELPSEDLILLKQRTKPTFKIDLDSKEVIAFNYGHSNKNNVKIGMVKISDSEKIVWDEEPYKANWVTYHRMTYHKNEKKLLEESIMTENFETMKEIIEKGKTNDFFIRNEYIYKCKSVSANHSSSDTTLSILNYTTGMSTVVTKVTNKTFITNFSILLTIGLISTSVLFLLNPASSDEFPNRALSEHIKYSASLESLILPGSTHTTQIISDYGMNISFYSFFDKPVPIGEIEHLIFLGYSVIFLSALAIIRYRQNHIWFWLLICGIFVVMSLGPELKIFHQSTGIVLPDKVFYDAVPEWDEIRAPARFIVMANLALAVLASYAVYGLIKNKFSSFKQQLMLTTIIGFVIIFEFSMIPYPSTSEPIPDIYDEIKNDEQVKEELIEIISGAESV